MKAWRINEDYVVTFTACGDSAASVAKKLLTKAKADVPDASQLLLSVEWVADGALGEEFNGLLTAVGEH